MMVMGSTHTHIRVHYTMTCASGGPRRALWTFDALDVPSDPNGDEVKAQLPLHTFHACCKGRVSLVDEW